MAKKNNNAPATRFNIMHAKEIGEGQDSKTYWTKCGVAFPLKDGKEGFRLVLEYIPTSGADGLFLFPHKDKD